MTGIIAALIIPEEVPSLLAVLGLLFCWELHDIEIRQGRINPPNLVAYLIPLRIELPMVGARPLLFIFMARSDPRTCRRCRAAHVHAFSGRTPWEAGARIRCEDPIGCRCVIIPLEGRWPAAKELSDRLNSQRGPVQLSEQDINDLIHHGRVGKISDLPQLFLTLANALLLVTTNAQFVPSRNSLKIAPPP